MKAIVTSNKEEMGMNRNEFFEYKKQRVVEMVKRGASVAEMATDLGMTEVDLYAFVSRNFGGLKKLRQQVQFSVNVQQFTTAAMSTHEETPILRSQTEKKPKGSGKTKHLVSDSNPSTILNAFKTSLEVEKGKLLTTFCKEVEEGSHEILQSVQGSLEGMKAEVLKNFKNGLMQDLSEIAKTL